MAYNPKVVRPRFGQVSIYNRDKTMEKNLMHFPIDDTQNHPFNIIQLVVETFGQSTWYTNQSKASKRPQSCSAYN